MRSFLFLTVSLANLALGLAAPTPTNLDSQIDDALKVYRSPNGFRIDATATDWELIPAPKKSKFVITSFRSKNAVNNIHASLTVRRDPIPKSKNLEGYVQKWLNQYPRFGFDVLGSKKIKHKETPGFLIDLVSRDGQKQLRQVVFLRDSDAYVLTCRDSKDNFKNSLKSCNKIIRSLEWDKL